MCETARRLLASDSSASVRLSTTKGLLFRHDVPLGTVTWTSDSTSTQARDPLSVALSGLVDEQHGRVLAGGSRSARPGEQELSRDVVPWSPPTSGRRPRLDAQDTACGIFHS